MDNIEPRLSNTMKQHLQIHLHQIKNEIDEIIEVINNQDCCILSKFEQTNHKFDKIQMQAACNRAL